MLAIRGATDLDLDRLVEIHTASYPDDRAAPARRLNFVQSALGKLEDLRVAERDGRIVGHGFGFDLEAWFGGAAVRTLGIASVAVAPEARGSGVARALVEALEAEARARGAALSLLHAFRHGFYARLGYAEVATNKRLYCDPRAIPSAWVKRARAAGLREATADDTAPIRELYEAAAKRATGWLKRPEAFWTRMLVSERLGFVVLEGAGYASYEISQREPHDKTRLYVRDLVAADEEARRVLWGFFGMQADQVAEIEVEIADDDPIAFALADVDRARFGDERVEHELGSVVAGPMIRLLDAKAALAARGYARDADARVVVEGEPLHVTTLGGSATVRPGDAAHGVELDARTLASVAFGGLPLAGAARLGLAHGSVDAVARAGELLSLPPFFTVDRF